MDNKQAGRKQLGELIATSHSSFTVESYALNNTPPLGSLVVAQNVLGVVGSARTEGLGPISARGSLEDEDGAVYQLYPDLQRTLRSEFTALVVGCYRTTKDEGRRTKDELSPSEGGVLVHAYPECPPMVHYKCWQASHAELVSFTEQPDYLRLLLSSTDSAEANIDQVIIHLVVRAFRARGNDYAWLASTAEYLGRQLKGQYDRLLAILKTLDALTANPQPASSEVSEAVGKVRL